VVDAGPAAREHFLVHWIATRPDADHVVRVLTPTRSTLPRQLEVDRGTSLSADPALLAQALRDAGAGAAKVTGTVYLETDDLR